MSQPARISGTAQHELAQAVRAIEHPVAAERLRHAVASAARHIGARPLLGRQEPTLADARYRFWSVPGFPYVIVYRADLAPPSIVRFVHTAHDLPVLLADLRP